MATGDEDSPHIITDNNTSDMLNESLGTTGSTLDAPVQLQSIRQCQAGLTLTWKNVNVWVKRKKPPSKFWSSRKFEHHQVLQNVCGLAKSGHLLAVMGASGSGKTTLLATISKRLKGNGQSGAILLNGKEIEKEFLVQISGFVPQKDLVIDTLTTQEHLQFMAAMKIDQEVKPLTRKSHIMSLLVDLNLVQCKDTRLSDLSGGERKRLSLAVELLTDPPIMFCDEPTTGLDSYSAVSVVEQLQLLATRGKIVICSIHQPASGIFSYFQELVLLAEGRLAYHGDTKEAADFFNSLGLQCPSAYNVADFYIQQLSVIPGKEKESQFRVDKLCDEFTASSYGKHLYEQVTATSTESFVEIKEKFKAHASIRKAEWYEQLKWLTWRSFTDSRRSPKGHFIRVGVFMITSIYLALTFAEIKLNQSGIQDIRGLLYLIISEVYFSCTYSVLYTFSQEIPTFLRESSNGLYQPATYYASKIISLVPQTMIEPFLFYTVIFLAVGFKPGLEAFFLLLVPVLLLASSASAFGCMMSAAFESPILATLLSSPVDQISLLMAGVLINIRSLPSGIRWLKYLSQFYYSNEALSILQWRDIKSIECSKKPSLPCLSSGSEVLEESGFSEKNLLRDFLLLVIFYVVLHTIGYLNVWRRSKNQPAY